VFKSLAMATMVMLAALALLLGLASTAAAAPWSDVEGATLDAYGISLDQISQISSGFLDGRWQPWQGVTRAQFAKMTVSAFGITLVSPGSPTFSDVSASDPFYQYVEGAHTAGLMNGVGEGPFDPSSTITREQAVAVVARKVASDQDFDLSSMGEPEISDALGGFLDAASVSPGLRAEMAFAVTRGLIRGDAAGNLSPKAMMSRIAAAALLIRAMAPTPLSLDERDNGSSVTLEVGETIKVVLKGNPTTGYTWTAALTEEDAAILQQVGAPTYVADSDLMGAGGTYTFTFKALATGEALLKLTYARPWESVPPLKTFTATVHVEALPLDGTAWRLGAWSVSSLYPGDFEITANFTDGRISGKSAVNLYSGSYTVGSSGEFSVGPLISTMMAGPEPAMRAESSYFELLGQARAYRANGDRLGLLDGSNKELLVFTAAPQIQESGIEGEVWIGPISPVSKPGEPNSRPYSAVIGVRRISEGRIVAEVTSDAEGRFRIALVPGTYLLEPQQGRPLPRASTQEVTVVAGQFTHVRIDYDSGIR
jgi:inhibitor of cysteine peptidase